MQEILNFLYQYGYVLLFGVVLMEQLGLPLPAIPVLLAMGALSGLGHFSLAVSLLLAIIASAAADGLWYRLGQFHGRPILRTICRISLEPDSCVRDTEKMFGRYGAVTLLFCKFVPGLSTAAPPMAGMTGMGLARFLLWDAAGTFVWAGTFLGIGWLLRAQVEKAAAAATQAGSWMLVVIVSLLGGWMLYKFLQRAHFLRLVRVARVTPDEVKTMLDESRSVALLDLRRLSEVEYEGYRLPGALHMAMDELDARHGEIPRDRDIILYCS